MYRTNRAGECIVDSGCPDPCVCEGTIVDCSGKRLRDIPENIPTFTTELRLNDNVIVKLKNNGLFSKLTNLNKIDLRNNQIVEIEDGAFRGATQLTDLLLTENKLKEVRPKMFGGLKILKTLMLRTNLLTCISNETFSGLESLQLLSLYDNRITTIVSGAFERMSALTTLNLLANPLQCNCHLKWLGEWLKKTNIVTGNPRCQAPLSLKDIPIQDIEQKDFKCDDHERGLEGCSAGLACPLGCACMGTVVQCSRRKLKAAPRGIPPTTTELYLDVNDISRIPDHLNIVKDLERLDLSNNQITVLPNNIISNLSKLSTLILSYNKLQCIEVDSLRGLRSLRILSLQGNDISMIPDGAFRELISITHIALGANPLYCDCNLRWLSEWIKKDYIEPGIARCAEPRSMKDKLVLTASSNSFICTGKPEPEVLAKCDSCYTFPCLNGATCTARPLLDYECICAPGYHGRHCEYVIDACYGNPCENSGTCKVLEAGRFSCHCPSGYEGDRCETNIDDCIDNKCENNSTCIDLLEEYRCACIPGYTGDYCEKKINFCSKEFNPCKNGATCIDETFTYSCACSLGFTGENCTVNIDDCVEHLCQNGGTCIDGVNSYRCQCQDGFSGAFCELENMVDILYPQTSPCQDHDCKHGACFMPSGAKDYICKCSQGFTGKRCDVLSSVSFHEGSFVELEPLQTKPQLNVTMTFITKQENGVLIYNGQSQHLAVELFRGRIRVSYDVGNYPVSTMFSYETVSDGEQHVVELLLVKKNFTMRVDSGNPRTIVNEGMKEYLEISSSLFMGGVSDEVAASALRQWHLRNTSSFDGCIKDVHLNGKPLDFMVAKKQQRITPGCGDIDDPKPCKDNLCKKGRCVPLDKTTYECQCRKGWSGDHCDRAPSCQKEQYREYLEESGCRSNKMIKMANCVGTCGDQCCRPQKIKRRSVRMLCPGGTRYTTQVDVIRKCKCVNKC